MENGRLSSVVDFGTSGIGDPSCDLAIAGTMFEGESRNAFRNTLPLDSGTWARGCGWILWKALIVAAGMADARLSDVEKSWSVIDEVLGETIRRHNNGRH